MTERLRSICSQLPKASVFADVGCDHGYCAQYMLENGLCERVYISDVSAGSLSKAERLLSEAVASGRCVPVLADGMKGLPPDCDCVLIAGLGGEEIVRILSEGYLPSRFVVQPMKNSERVRAFLLERGCSVTADYTFFAEGKYYDLIAGENAGGSVYSDWELRYGRDNLKDRPAAFLNRLREEQGKIRARLCCKEMKRESREELLKRLYEMEVITDAVDGNI